MRCYACGEEMKIFMRRFEHDFWRCSACKLERIFPQPEDDVLSKIYGKDYFEEGWGFSPEKKESIKRMKKATFRRYLKEIDISRISKVLDCGAGLGYMLEVAKEFGWEPYAVEISSFGADMCRKIVGEKNVFQGDITELDFSGYYRSSGFDLITMFDFIEHTKDPLATLNRAREIITDGGYLLITTPRVDGLLRKIMGKYWFHYKLEHLWYFSTCSIKLLLEKARFRVTKIKPALKFITLDYAYHQLKKYRVPVLSEMFELVKFSRKLKKIYLPVSIGEMMVVSVPC